ncbi:MAG: hypothetical protein AAB657_05280 [Patescibacteria group bacterium]
MNSLKKSISILVVLAVVITLFVLNGQDKDIKLSSVLSKEIRLPKLVETIINKIGRYGLDCQTTHYSAIVTGGFLIDESYVKIAEGHEKQVLYVEDKTAKFFGADYAVIQDDESYLVIVRTYPVSGLTETVTINKEKGIGFDTKTMGMGISGGPQSDTYILKCLEI